MIEKGTDENFASLIKDGFVLVDFFGSWCGPCKMLAPILKEIAESKLVKVVTVDIDKENLPLEYGIMSVPTLILFKDGKQVSSKTGYMPKDVLENWILEHK